MATYYKAGTKVLTCNSQLLIPSTGSKTVYTDNFDSYIVGNLGGQGYWVDSLNHITVVDESGNKTVGTTDTNFLDHLCYYNRALAAAQYAKFVISTMTASSRAIGVAVRCAASGNGYCYYASSGERFLFKLVAGAEVQMCAYSTAAGVNAGDTMELRANGTSIRAYYNGALDTLLGASVAPTTGSNGDYVDSVFSSGFAGVCGFGGDTGYLADADTWEGGEL